MPPPVRVQVLPEPFKAAASLRTKQEAAAPDMDSPMIKKLKDLKTRHPHAHWERIAEKIRSTVHRNFATEPALLQNPKPFLSSKGRPTESQVQMRAVARLKTSSQKSSSSTKRIPSSWEKHEKGARNRRLCVRVNAGHDSRNCPKSPTGIKMLVVSFFHRALPITGPLRLQLPGLCFPRYRQPPSHGQQYPQHFHRHCPLALTI